jgi:hypothetical protein
MVVSSVELRIKNADTARLLGHRQTKGAETDNRTYCHRATSQLYRDALTVTSH